ncbi:MAG: TIGR01906 family membrane protein [Firmicutes bacterium]|nr:TIGR01906 family membrane protein [Bacillota bacterium]
MLKTKIGLLLFAIFLSLTVLLTAVELVAFNINHYLSAYERHQVVEATGMDMENLEHVTREIINYLRNRQDVLNPQAVVDGELRYVYGEREQLHMVDVKDLFNAGRQVRNFSVLALLPLSIWLFAGRHRERRIFKGVLTAFLINAGLLLVLLALMFIDFNQAFTWFHLLLFDNDLWLLPWSSLMIRMLPEVFFFESAVKILAIHFGVLLASTLACYALYKKKGEN